MSLSIATTNNNVTEWHVGEQFPIGYRAISNIAEIQADGDELDIILSLCTNIPVAPRRVLRWFGDDARFICSVLLHQSVMKG